MSSVIEDLKQLPITERIQLVEDLWDTIALDSPEIPLTPEHLTELDRRLDSLEAVPQSGTPWNAVRGHLLNV